jgi:hypothetical protein
MKTLVNNELLSSKTGFWRTFYPWAPAEGRIGGNHLYLLDMSSYIWCFWVASLFHWH